MNFSAITQLYPTAILTGVEQYFCCNKWHAVTPSESPKEPASVEAFTTLIELLLLRGATKIALRVQCQETKTLYTVFVRAPELLLGQTKRPYVLALKPAGLKKRETELLRKEAEFNKKNSSLKQVEGQIKRKEEQLKRYKSGSKINSSERSGLASGLTTDGRLEDPGPGGTSTQYRLGESLSGDGPVGPRTKPAGKDRTENLPLVSGRVYGYRTLEILLPRPQRAGQ